MAGKKQLIFLSIILFCFFSSFAFEYTNSVFEIEQSSDEYTRTIINGFNNNDTSRVEIFDDNTVTLGAMTTMQHFYQVSFKESNTDPVTGAPLNTYKVFDIDSRPLLRSGIFHFVVESKYGMADWTDLTLFFKLFLNQNHAPMNVYLNPAYNSNFSSIGRNPAMDWDEVPTDPSSGFYAPFNVPPGAASCSTWDPSMGQLDGGGVYDITGKSGWNIRLWFYPSNIFDKVAGINFSEAFASDLIINKFTGKTIGITSFNQEKIKKVIPTYNPPPTSPMYAFGPMTLTPNNDVGVVPAWTTGGTGKDTREIHIDLSPYNLYGRYLVVLCQLYAYDRYQVPNDDFPINGFRSASFNSGPTNPTGLWNTIGYRLPGYYDHTWNAGLPDTMMLNKPQRPLQPQFPFEVPPLSTAMHIKKFKVNYNIMNFDIFLDRNSPGAGKLSLDHMTKYYQWRSIQNYYNGKFESGYVEREQ